MPVLIRIDRCEKHFGGQEQCWELGSLGLVLLLIGHTDHSKNKPYNGIQLFQVQPCYTSIAYIAHLRTMTTS